MQATRVVGHAAIICIKDIQQHPQGEGGSKLSTQPLET